ncbi:MAG: hypothetical protein QM765_25860 [Myxococcales bacterium]
MLRRRQAGLGLHRAGDALHQPEPALFFQTVASYQDAWPIYRSNEEIAELLQRWKLGRN